MNKEKNHITIHDIARELGISGSTVSRALHGNPRISSTTREAVLKLAKKYSYTPNSVAASLRKGQGSTVGVIVPNINRSFFSSVIAGLEEVLTRAGYKLIICQSNESIIQEEEAINTLLHARVDAIVMSLSMESQRYDHIQRVIDQGMRLVFFDRVPENLKGSSVVINDFQASYQITNHLCSKGYRRIAHFGGSLLINVYAERLKGYKAALADNGITPDSNYIIEGEMTRIGGIEAYKSFMKLSPRPDAIVCSGDFAALGVLQAARKDKINVPSDLAITGFANEEYTPYLSPSLTTVDQKGVEMGRSAAEAFLEKRENEKIVIDPEVIFRESSSGFKTENL